MTITSRGSGLVCLVAGLALAHGCGQEAEPGQESTVSPPAPASFPARSPSSTQSKTLEVTVSEGTNLSFALSSDGGTLVLSLQGVLFALPIEGGVATALTGYYLDAREPSFSPDGNTVVFHGYRNGTWDLWSLPMGGGDPLPLTSDPFDDREAVFSPRGGEIAFASDRDGNYDIWLYDVGTGRLTQVTATPEDEHAPTWSPDGAQLAYVSATDQTRSALKRIEIATGIGTTVIEEPGSINGITWEPDGRTLTYQLASPGVTELRTVPTPGGTAATISEPGDDVFPFRSATLDDGSLLYAANGVINRRTPTGERAPIPFEATFELDRQPYERRRRNHDDRSARRALGLAHPAISPDGQTVTFSALGDLWLWQPGGGALQNLTDSPFAERSPRFSPDGGRIAYISDQPGPDGRSVPSLWIYHIADDRHARVDLATSGVANPAWSPDGRSIALFASIAGSPLASQLTVADLEDGSLTPVHTPVPAQEISWSQDGAFVATTQLAPYSGRYREGVYRLIVASPESDERYEVEPVPHKNITGVTLTPTGHAMSYVQDGQLWRQRLSEYFEPQGYPEPLTAQLTDAPSWSSGGEYVVFMNADRMMRLEVSTGEAVDITPDIQWQPDRLNATWTLKIGRLFDGVGNGYIENALVTIDGNRIRSIRPDAADAAADLDASDKAAFPGLFEMHAHMGELSESQGRAWLAYGVTSVRDPGSDPYLAKERQEFWDSGRSPGPRTHVTGYLADGNRVYYSVAEGIASDIHLDRALERAERLRLDFIKTYVRLPDHRQKRVVEFAHEIGIPVSSHELFPAVAHGTDHVEHIGGTSRRGYQPKVTTLGNSYDDVLSLLTASGMGITPTAVLPGYAVIATEEPDLFDTPQFAHFYGPAGRQAATMVARIFGSGADITATNNAKLIRELAAADALLVTGTDAPFVPYGAGLHAELRLYARAGLTPAQILKAASVNSARAAGVNHDIGTLVPGKIADLVLVDGDPLADIADADNVFMTIKNGRGYRLETLLETPSG